MSKITVVIDGATAGVHLGMQLAGGRVTSASVGDLIEPHEQFQAVLRKVVDLRDCGKGPIQAFERMKAIAEEARSALARIDQAALQEKE